MRWIDMLHFSLDRSNYYYNHVNGHRCLFALSGESIMKRQRSIGAKTAVLLAGDPFDRLKRLASHLNANTAFEAVAVPLSVPDGNAVVSLISHHRPDIVLYNFPGAEKSISSLAEIVRLFGEVRAVALTDCTDMAVALAFVSSGGWGYLLKRCSDEEILAAIHRVASGEKTFCPVMGWEVLSSISAESPPFSSTLLEKLPGHLRRIILGIQNEDTPEEIAEKYCISPKSARLYRQKIMEILGVHSVVELQRRLKVTRLK